MPQFRSFIKEAESATDGLEMQRAPQPALDQIMHQPVQERKEKKRLRKAIPVTILCWRGFSDEALERDVISQNGSSYVLSPYQTPEHILWFTNSLQQNANSVSPIDYAKGFATKENGSGFLLTVPLQGIKHFDEIIYDDGTGTIEPPQDLLIYMQQEDAKGGLTRFKNYHGAIYELPKGWGFTRQIEKHIACQIDFKINKKQLQRIEE